MPNCVYFYLVPLSLHCIGNLLAYVAALFVTTAGRVLSVRGLAGRASDSESRGRRLAFDT